MQLDQMKCMLMAPGTQHRWTLKYVKLLSIFGFNFTLRRYIQKWDGKDYTACPVLIKALGKCTTDHISMAGEAPVSFAPPRE